MGKKERDIIAASEARYPDIADIALIGMTLEESRKHREEAKESWAGTPPGRREYPDGTYVDVSYDVDKFTNTVDSEMGFVRIKQKIKTNDSIGDREVVRYLTLDDYNRFIGDGVEVAWSWGMLQKEMEMYIAMLALQKYKRDDS